MKRCIRCEILIEGKAGQKYCKDCAVESAKETNRQYMRKYHSEKRDNLPKECNTCKRLLNRSEFRKTTSGNIVGRCKECEKTEGRLECAKNKAWLDFWKQYSKDPPRYGVLYKKGKIIKYYE